MPYGDLWQFRVAKNKAKQCQFISYWVLRDAYCEKESEKTKPKPAFGRKSEVRIPKSDNSGGVAGCLLPRVGRETSWKGAIWKNKANVKMGKIVLIQ